MAEPVVTPSVKWAQRKKFVYITLETQDVGENKVVLTPEGTLKFSGNAPTKRYELELQLFNEVNVEKSKWKITGRTVDFKVWKKEENDPYWPRLTKENKKLQWLSLDWNRYVDEDEEQEEEGHNNEEDYDNLPQDSDDEQEQMPTLEELQGTEQKTEEKTEEQKTE